MIQARRRRNISAREAEAILEEGDRMLAAGFLKANVCHVLGISHVVYDRLSRRYGRGAAREAARVGEF